MGVTRGCSSPEPGGHSSLGKSRPIPGRSGSPHSLGPAPQDMGRGCPIPGRGGCPPWSGEKHPQSRQGWVTPWPGASSPWSGERSSHSGQDWVPPMVWGEATPFQAGLGAPHGLGRGRLVPGRAGCPPRSGKRPPIPGRGGCPHGLGPAPQGQLAVSVPVPWQRGPCRGFPAGALMPPLWFPQMASLRSGISPSRKQNCFLTDLRTMKRI